MAAQFKNKPKRKITIEVITYKDSKEFNVDDQYIDEYLRTFLQGKVDKLLCLDLHNVVDLCPIATQISDLPICVVSFVGKGLMRDKARDEITKRITANKQMMGILIFERPKMPKEECKKLAQFDIKKCDPRVLGTKAWVIGLWKYLFPNVKILFVDDGQDHIDLVEGCKIFGVTTCKVSGKSYDEVSQAIIKF